MIRRLLILGTFSLAFGCILEAGSSSAASEKAKDYRTYRISPEQTSEVQLVDTFNNNPIWYQAKLEGGMVINCKKENDGKVTCDLLTGFEDVPDWYPMAWAGKGNFEVIPPENFQILEDMYNKQKAAKTLPAKFKKMSLAPGGPPID